ncbi:MAG TPA: hypothetical protein VD793_08815 [Gemmatimonadales bacterium]|nr:hypothetical protein [Gemmatimonadales bacterium]
MTKPTPPRSSQDLLAREVDKLLRKLPGADPTLRGEPEPARRPATGPPGVGAPSVGPRPDEPSRRAQQVGVWLRGLMAAGLGVALTQWPYARSCGWALYAYLGVIAALLVAGGWAATWSWRVRVAAAHVLSLVVVFWGIVLAAEQLLPRVGYAAESAVWTCPP